MTGWLLRPAYLGVTSASALLRLPPLSDPDKDVEIPALRHQITILEPQPGKDRPQFSPGDRAFLAALPHRLPAATLHRLRLRVLRLARENPAWVYHRIHGELLVLGIEVAASSAWQILQDAGIDPAPDCGGSTDRGPRRS